MTSRPVTARKKAFWWGGYLTHLTETCDPEQPLLITQVQTVPATTADHEVTELIQVELQAHDRLPGRHLVDGGYIEAHHLVTSPKK